jgi:hypothetical protein
MDGATARRATLTDRDVRRTFVGLLVLVGVAFGVQARPLQVPGDLVFVGGDALQNRVLPDVGETAFWSLFVGYCYLVAVVLVSLAGASASSTM